MARAKTYSSMAKLLFRMLYTVEEVKGRSLFGGDPQKGFSKREGIKDPAKLDVIFGKFHDELSYK